MAERFYGKGFSFLFDNISCVDLVFASLFLSIIKSLRGTLPKPFLTIPISVRRTFGVWEAVKKGPISY